MHSGFINNIVQAFGWTLVHSLWQGLILSVLAGLVIMFTKRSGPAIRYNLLSVLGVLFLLAVCYTFFYEVQSGSGRLEGLLATTRGRQTWETTSQAMFITTNHSYSWFDKFNYYFSTYNSWIVLVWFIFFLVKFIRLATGLNFIQALKGRKSHPASVYWQQRMEELAQTLHINRRVQLLESFAVKVPVVLGYIKPVIIFPVGLLSGIPPEQTEAILLHELAHIRRSDWLANLFQYITESIFFFNPSVLWLSAILRQERENCCDAMAIAKTDNKINYIKALVSFQEYQPSVAGPAMALYDTTPHLLQRIKRILYNNNKTLNAMEKTFLTSGIVLAALTAIGFSSRTPVPNENNIDKAPVVGQRDFLPQQARKAYMIKDTVPQKKPFRETKVSEDFNGTIITTGDGKEYKFKLYNGSVSDLYVDGKSIPNEKMGEYKVILDKLITEMKAKTLQARDQTEQAIREVEIAKIYADESKEKSEFLLKKLDAQRSLIEEQRKEVEKGGKDTKEIREKMGKDREVAEILMQKIENLQKDVSEQRIKAEADLKVMEKYREQADIYKEKALNDREEARRQVEEIISMFIAEKIIKDKSELISFSLSGESLIVNKVKQSDALHRKFKEKFMIDTQYREFKYNNQ